MSTLAINTIVPLQFYYQETKQRLLPILAEKFRQFRYPSHCAPTSYTNSDNNVVSWCCQHPLTVNLPPRVIIQETNLAQLRTYAMLAAHCNTICCNFEILEALHGLGLLFKPEDFQLWQELLHLGKLEDALYFEHAACEEAKSIHPSIIGPEFDLQREHAKQLYANSRLKQYIEFQNENDRQIDEEADRQTWERFCGLHTNTFVLNQEFEEQFEKF